MLGSSDGTIDGFDDKVAVGDWDGEVLGFVDGFSEGFSEGFFVG